MMTFDTGKFGKVLAFVAHPDDETLGCSGLLQRADSSLVVFAVDAAPAHYGFERRFGSLQQYSDTRFQEAARALALLPNCSFRRLRRPDGTYFADQHLFLELPAAFQSLKQLIAEFSPEVIVTHAFEGGHLDHDACHVLAAQVARESRYCVLELPLYWNTGPGKDVFQEFRERQEPEVILTLTREELAVKRRMLAEYPSQSSITVVFSREVERFRTLTPQKISAPVWRDYPFENKRRRLKAEIFVQKAAEFERGAASPPSAAYATP